MTPKDIKRYKNMIDNHNIIYYSELRKLFPDYDDMKRISDKNQKDGGHFENIPYNINSFIGIMKDIPERDRFLDVGCGTGEKPFIAHLLGFKKSIGIEYTKEYYEYSIKNIKIPNIEFKNMDAFDYDFSHEQVVYLYHPMKYNEYMLDLWGKIIDELPPGGIMIEVSPNATGEILSPQLEKWGCKYLYPNTQSKIMYKRII